MKNIISPLLLVFSSLSFAGEWCDIQKGFSITENSGNLTLTGTLIGTNKTTMHHEWLVMDVSNQPDATKARLALVMSAKMADKPLMIHVKDTCASVTNWTRDQILHIRLK